MGPEREGRSDAAVQPAGAGPTCVRGFRPLDGSAPLAMTARLRFNHPDTEKPWFFPCRATTACHAVTDTRQP